MLSLPSPHPTSAGLASVTTRGAFQDCSKTDCVIKSPGPVQVLPERNDNGHRGHSLSCTISQGRQFCALRPWLLLLPGASVQGPHFFSNPSFPEILSKQTFAQNLKTQNQSIYIHCDLQACVKDCAGQGPRGTVRTPCSWPWGARRCLRTRRCAELSNPTGRCGLNRTLLTTVLEKETVDP